MDKTIQLQPSEISVKKLSNWFEGWICFELFLQIVFVLDVHPKQELNYR